METKNNNLVAAIEALLFVYGEPMEIKKIAKLLKSDPKLRIQANEPNKSEEFEEIIKKSLAELNQQYLSEQRGLKLIFKDSLNGGSVQLVTKPEFASFLENFIKEEFKENLTPAPL